VCHLQGLGPPQQLSRVAHQPSGRPRPPYLSTITQLGLTGGLPVRLPFAAAHVPSGPRPAPRACPLQCRRRCRCRCPPRRPPAPLGKRIRPFLPPPSPHTHTTDTPPPPLRPCPAGAEGTLSLLDFALPTSGVPALARAWLRQQLLLPPAPAVAAATQQLLRQLQGLEEPLPAFNASVPSSKIIQVRRRTAPAAGGGRLSAPAVPRAAPPPAARTPLPAAARGRRCRHAAPQAQVHRAPLQPPPGR
jgi:hypothetical protein